MAIPTDSQTLSNLVTATYPAFRPDLVDGVFNSNPFLARLMAKDKALLDGGRDVRVHLLYDKLPGGAYTGLGPFSTAQKEVWTDLIFQWKQYYAEITLAEIDIAKNSGDGQIFSLLSGQMSVAKMTLADFLGTDLYNTGSDAEKLTGLRHAVNTTGAYGGITRGSDVVGTAAKGQVDTTGGSITLPIINALMGTASAGGAVKPDLLLTTQTLWDAVWARVQPSQRFRAGEGDSWDVGARYIDINGAALVADSHCPSGYMFGLNTDFWEFYVMQGKDFYLRGPFPFPDQDGITAQVIVYAELACQNPRLNFNASGLTA